MLLFVIHAHINLFTFLSRSPQSKCRFYLCVTRSFINLELFTTHHSIHSLSCQLVSLFIQYFIIIYPCSVFISLSLFISISPHSQFNQFHTYVPFFLVFIYLCLFITSSLSFLLVHYLFFPPFSLSARNNLTHLAGCFLCKDENRLTYMYT